MVLRLPRCSTAALAAAIALAAPGALAQDRPAKPAPSANDVEQATAAFALGETAFRAGDYTKAAGHFERAHRLLAHHDAAWNAGQAWLRAGNDPKAADWLATFLSEAPESAPDRTDAKAKLDDLTTRLGRIEVKAVGFDRVRIDDEPSERATKYVRPGDHVVEGAMGDRLVRERASVHANELVVVELRVPPATEPEKPRTETPLPPAPSQGWSPLVVVVGGIVTVGLGATAIIFGTATERARTQYDAAPSTQLYEDGKTKQDFANGFFWGTLAAGLATGAIAIFLVDWKKPLATRPILSF